MYIERPDLQTAAQNIWDVEEAQVKTATAAAALPEGPEKTAVLEAMQAEIAAVKKLHAHADETFKTAGGEYMCHDAEGAEDLTDDEDVIVTPDSTGSGGKGDGTGGTDPGTGNGG